MRTDRRPGPSPAVAVNRRRPTSLDPTAPNRLRDGPEPCLGWRSAPQAPRQRPLPSVRFYRPRETANAHVQQRPLRRGVMATPRSPTPKAETEGPGVERGSDLMSRDLPEEGAIAYFAYQRHGTP